MEFAMEQENCFLGHPVLPARVVGFPPVKMLSRTFDADRPYEHIVQQVDTSAELFCNSAAFVQILALSSAGILTRSIRNGGWCRASRGAGNAYSWTLDHFQCSGRFSSPRGRDMGKEDSLFQ
jgi:hypothetical protein